jgi:hypothetical protein
LLRRLREAENRDRIANSFARVKLRDDATAIAGSWSNGA